MSSLPNESTKGVQNYINTLIFCIVVKGISIFILVLLLFKFGQRYAYALLTVEVCLILIVIYALLRIRYYENKIVNEYVKQKTSAIDLNNCPDYYVKRIENDTVFCSSNYVTPNDKFTYEMAPNDDTLKDINITQISNDGKNTIEGICEIVNDNASDFKTKLAWSDLKPHCD